MCIAIKDSLINETNFFFAMKTYRKKIKESVFDFFDYCDYDLDKMSSDTFGDFIFENKIEFIEAYYARGIIRNILLNKFDISKTLWNNYGTAKLILDKCDMKNETRRYIYYKDWNNFCNKFVSIIENNKNIDYCKNYVSYCFAWNGIPPYNYNNIKIEDVFLNNDMIKVFIKKENKEYVIKDKILMNCLRFIFQTKDNLEENFLKNKLKANKIKEPSLVYIFSSNIQDIYYSGISYHLTKGFDPYIPKNNTYLKPYFEAISEYMYGENREE